MLVCHCEARSGEAIRCGCLFRLDCFVVGILPPPRNDGSPRMRANG
ncbi:MAG: hypothetical protein LBT00_15165 [Spirochaetaceae bacterium]|nr:hypothetical protein [Spirochaetaceae bacterium]